MLLREQHLRRSSLCIHCSSNLVKEKQLLSQLVEEEESIKAGVEWRQEYNYDELNVSISSSMNLLT